MAQITDLSEVRSKKQKERTGKGILMILGLLLLTAVMSILFNSRSEYGLSSFMDLFESGKGYPIEAPSGKSKGMYKLDSLLCLTNDTDLIMYNNRGGEAYSVKHQMSDPHVQVQDSMLLIFDQGSKSYTLYQRNVPLVDSETSHSIYTAAVSSKGLFALATRSEDYLSQVTVFDKNNATKYSWNYSDKVVSAVALSPSGNKLAVSGLYAQDGTIHSQLMLYDNGQLIDSRNFDDAVICSLTFVGETELRGISDQGAFLISDKGKLRGEYDYKSQPLAAYSNTPESTVLLLGDYRQDGGYQVVYLNSDMVRQSSTTIKGNIHTLKADASNAYILAGNKYYQVDLKNGEILVNEDADYIYDLQPIGKGVFAVTSTQIVRMEQVKGSDEENTEPVVPEQPAIKDETEDWETPTEENPVEVPPEESPSEEPEVPDEETPIEPEPLPETPTGTAPGDPGL